MLCFLSQAARARALGAIVYCVGVKDFNETQVKKKIFLHTRWTVRNLFHYPIYTVLFYIQHVCWTHHVLNNTQTDLCFCPIVAGYHSWHHRARVSCDGRIPSSQRRDWLGKQPLLLNKIQMKQKLQTSNTTTGILNMTSISFHSRFSFTEIKFVLACYHFSNLFILFNRSSGNPALRSWQLSHPVYVQEVGAIRQMSQ